MAEKINYVKFIRGTPAAFERLKVKDPDTLYFVKEKDKLVGSLYIGDTKISGVDKLTDVDLEDLHNVNVNQDNLIDGSILKYDWTNQEWVEGTIEELQIPVFTGATATDDGTSGLVPMPVAGDQNKFLRGDATWVSVDDMIDAATQGLKSQVNTLSTTVETHESSIKVLQKAVADLDPSLYTLKSTYKAEVGNIDDLNISDDNTNGTIIEELNSINKRLTWNNY